MKRAREVFWIVNYLQDIQADFFAIYHVPDWEDLDGPLFVSLAERLPLYEGALQGRMKLEESAEDSDDDMDDIDDLNYNYTPRNDAKWAPGQTLSMAEALSGDSRLHALNKESQRDGWGDIFEMTTG
jgi:hypothetical protein